MLLEFKPIIDKMVQSKWTKTPIQYDGIPFTLPSPQRWISVKFIPVLRESMGNGGLHRDIATLQIFCYDESATLSYMLANDVVKTFECTQVDGAYIKSGVPDGSGAVSLDNGTYESMVSFEVELLSNTQIQGC